MMVIRFRGVLGLVLVSGLMVSSVTAAEKLKALIVDGQNNHAVWPKTTKMMQEVSGRNGPLYRRGRDHGSQGDRSELQAGVRQVRCGGLELQRSRLAG